MSPDDLCICGHTYEVHFGHDCSALFASGRPCPCKQFVLGELGVQLFQTLKKIAVLPVKSGCPECQEKVAMARRMIARAEEL